jgi:hypothetical protein
VGKNGGGEWGDYRMTWKKRTVPEHEEEYRVCDWCGEEITDYSSATVCESNPKMPELQNSDKQYAYTLGDNNCEKWTPGCKCNEETKP